MNVGRRSFGSDTTGANNTEGHTVTSVEIEHEHAPTVAIGCLCFGRRNGALRGPAMSYGLGVLVTARRLLHQSKPSIEVISR